MKYENVIRRVLGEQIVAGLDDKFNFTLDLEDVMNLHDVLDNVAKWEVEERQLLPFFNKLKEILAEAGNELEASEDESEDDGQPTEYEEWQDYHGGDDNAADYSEQY